MPFNPMKDDPQQLAARSRANAERAAMTAVQARADAAQQVWGRAAPPPMQGEGFYDYRIRMLQGVQSFSDEWKGVNLPDLDINVLHLAEQKIYADSVAAARDPRFVADGELREIKTKDESGRVVSEFIGRPDAWMQDFKAPPRRLVKINAPEPGWVRRQG